MSDVTHLPGNRILDSPDIPPRRWFREDSPDFIMGQSLQIVVDGPDEGRAFGLLQPPPHGSAFSPGKQGSRHRQYGQRPPDARLYPDGMATFNRGAIAVINDDGSTGTINAGKLTVGGGHSQEMVGAQTLDDAVDYLRREGRFAHLGADVALVGVASPVTAPGFEGAVMFRGAALPGMTSREALTVNATSYSAEVWPSAAHGNKHVFAGAVQCEHTAWPYASFPESLAASTGCVGPECVIYETPEPGSVVVSDACACHNPEPKPVEPPPAAQPDPVTVEDLTDLYGGGAEMIAAEVTDNEFSELNAQLDKLREDFDALAVEVAALAITQYAGEGLGQENEIAGLKEQVAALQALVDQLHSNDNPTEPDNSNDSSSGGGQVTLPGALVTS